MWETYVATNWPEVCLRDQLVVPCAGIRVGFYRHPYNRLESFAAVCAFASNRALGASHCRSRSHHCKGKPVVRRGRKAMGLNRSEGGLDKVARLPKGWTGPESMSGNPGGAIRLCFFVVLCRLCSIDGSCARPRRTSYAPKSSVSRALVTSATSSKLLFAIHSRLLHTCTWQAVAT